MITRYLAHALARAQYRLLEDGTFAATVRGLRGVIATGPTLEACRRDLTEVIEEWVLVRTELIRELRSDARQEIGVASGTRRS